jgi:hypothetical protein
MPLGDEWAEKREWCVCGSKVWKKGKWPRSQLFDAVREARDGEL